MLLMSCEVLLLNVWFVAAGFERVEVMTLVLLLGVKRQKDTQR